MGDVVAVDNVISAGAVKPAYANDPLWLAISSFVFDAADDQFQFSARVAWDNGWSHDHAYRVIEEYRRFCFLAMRAGHPVAPSDQVDQVWHQHLLYTKSYWDEFCGKLLARPFHHQPSRGGTAERKKLHTWYEETLSSYGHIFGEAPPADIWPGVADRFRAITGFQRINVRDYWIVRKPRSFVEPSTRAAQRVCRRDCATATPPPRFRGTVISAKQPCRACG